MKNGILNNFFFKNRSLELEKMDLDDFSFENYQSCLNDIERINRWTFAYNDFFQVVEEFLRKKNTKKNNLKQQNQEPLRILDVGCGGGELLRVIKEKYIKENWFEKYGKIKLTGIDKNPWAKKVANQNLLKCRSEKTVDQVEIDFITKDIFEIKEDESFDLIICSLFTHHLTNTELIKYLKWLNKKSKVGWFISDIHRQWIPYFAMEIIPKLFNLNKMVQYDAPLSVRKSFKKNEWHNLLREVGSNDNNAEYITSVNWSFPFKYSVKGVRNEFL